jgi:CPA2 family monovalent cation:H+ antiporter-2
VTGFSLTGRSAIAESGGMHGVALLQDLAVVMIVAGVVTIIFHRLKQPVVLGYIVAGVIIGPHTPPFPLIHDEETIKNAFRAGSYPPDVLARAGV